MDWQRLTLRFTLPTVDYMEQCLAKQGPGSYMYKTDLSRGYGQLQRDANDLLLLGFMHRGLIYLDICPNEGTVIVHWV